MNEPDLLMFYGTECPHCHDMDPLVEKLEKETRLTVEKIEVWHSEGNAQMMNEFDRGYCGGVPFFFNKRTGKWICGATSYENLKKWAVGEDHEGKAGIRFSKMKK